MFIFTVNVPSASVLMALNGRALPPSKLPMLATSIPATGLPSASTTVPLAVNSSAYDGIGSRSSRINELSERHMGRLREHPAGYRGCGERKKGFFVQLLFPSLWGRVYCV